MPLSKSRIEHVIYYMLENRSFDNVLGWLYESKEEKENIKLISHPSQQDIRFNGLEEEKYSNCFPGEEMPQPVIKGVDRPDTPSVDPLEEYENINVQLFYPDWNKPWLASPPSDTTPTMKGFLANYSTQKTHIDFGKPIGRQTALEILQTFNKTQLNILNTLGENFAVSDAWFSSVPTQTNANRAFSLTGSSEGLVNNQGFLFGEVPDKFTTAKDSHNIWKELCDNGHDSTQDWMIYYQDLLPSRNKETGKIELKGFSYTQNAFNVPDPKRHVAHIEELFATLMCEKDCKPLPAFSYLEPLWVGLFETSGIFKDTFLPNSYHPPAEVAPGELFVKRLYDALRSNEELWNKTLLIITFDEHGGTYDHVPPPQPAAPPGLAGKPPLPGGELGFGFDRFGVRVPAIMISPWIEPQTVFRSLTDDTSASIRTPYDHCSVIKTILTWDRFNIDVDAGKFGQRVANAPSFESVLNVSGDKPRDDAPCKMPCPHFPVKEARVFEFSALQALVLPLIVKIVNTFSHTEAKQKAQEILEKSETMADIHQALLELAREKR